MKRDDGPQSTVGGRPWSVDRRLFKPTNRLSLLPEYIPTSPKSLNFQFFISC